MQAPRAVEFQTTTACNARCVICPWPDVRGAGRLKRMPEGVWRKLLDDLIELQPKRVIPYLNNEPLIDLELEARIDSIRHALGDPEIEVSTNAALLTPARASALMTSGTTHLLVSIFGYDQPSHHRIMALDYAQIQSNVLDALTVRRDLAANTRITVVQIDAPGLDRRRLADERSRWLNAGAEVELYGYLDRAGNVHSGAPQRDRRLRPNGCELNRHRQGRPNHPDTRHD